MSGHYQSTQNDCGRRQPMHLAKAENLSSTTNNGNDNNNEWMCPASQKVDDLIREINNRITPQTNHITKDEPMSNQQSTQHNSYYDQRLETHMSNQRQELQSFFSGIRQESRADFANFANELKSEVREVKQENNNHAAEIRQENNKIKWFFITTLLAVISSASGLAITLVIAL